MTIHTFQFFKFLVGGFIYEGLITITKEFELVNLWGFQHGSGIGNPPMGVFI